MNWNNSRFLYSVGKKEDLPPPTLAEIALVGRSNVGKSSLLNHLLNHKDLARVSKTPGKTKLINFFDVDSKFLLVDLPGYGYAKVAHSERERWAPLIDSYLMERPSLRLICQLIDSRHPPTEDDIAFANWVKIPLLFLFTKSDLAPSKREFLSSKTDAHVNYSIKSGTARQVLRAYLQKICVPRDFADEPIPVLEKHAF